MNEERNPRGNTVLLTVIAVATLLVAVIGATFAYFTVSVSGNDTATSVIVKTAKLGIVYEQGSTISLDNLVPGDSRLNGTTNKWTFTVENESTVNMEYDIVWTNIVNTFSAGHCDLYYELDSELNSTGTPVTGGTKTATIVPAAGPNVTMLADIQIVAGDIHKYELLLNFPNTSSSQDLQQNKTFAAKIEIHSDL